MAGRELALGLQLGTDEADRHDSVPLGRPQQPTTRPVAGLFVLERDLTEPCERIPDVRRVMDRQTASARRVDVRKGAIRKLCALFRGEGWHARMIASGRSYDPSTRRRSALPSVFISYRRDETSGHVARIYDRLTSALGTDEVLMDLTLEPADDFVKRIHHAVSECRVVLVVIGPEWATAQDADGCLRLSYPHDFVRLELEAAVESQGARVIPTLVHGAQMPRREALPESLRPILHRDAIELSEARWTPDITQLTDAITRATRNLA